MLIVQHRDKHGCVTESAFEDAHLRDIFERALDREGRWHQRIHAGIGEITGQIEPVPAARA